MSEKLTISKREYNNVNNEYMYPSFAVLQVR